MVHREAGYGQNRSLSASKMHAIQSDSSVFGQTSQVKFDGCGAALSSLFQRLSAPDYSINIYIIYICVCVRVCVSETLYFQVSAVVNIDQSVQIDNINF